jgi:hypothetical protein
MDESGAGLSKHGPQLAPETTLFECPHRQRGGNHNKKEPSRATGAAHESDSLYGSATATAEANGNTLAGCCGPMLNQAAACFFVASPL